MSLGAISPARRKFDPTRGSGVEIALDTGVREPLAPGEPVDPRLSLTPAPVRLRRGEKRRLIVAGRTDLVLSTAHDHAHLDWQVPPYFSRNSVRYGESTCIEVQQAALDGSS